jgi:hypothetical protein
VGPVGDGGDVVLPRGAQEDAWLWGVRGMGEWRRRCVGWRVRHGDA